MSDQEKRIQEIMERAESGTKNDWFVPKNAKQIVFNEQDHPLIVARCEDAEDAEFIAHARQDIPYLLDLVESLQRERDNPQPLTLEQMLDMEGAPVWTVTIGLEYSGRYELCTAHMACACPLHRVLRCVTAIGEVTDYELDSYGKTWLAYATEPKGENHD